MNISITSDSEYIRTLIFLKELRSPAGTLDLENLRVSSPRNDKKCSFFETRRLQLAMIRTPTLLCAEHDYVNNNIATGLVVKKVHREKKMGVGKVIRIELVGGERNVVSFVGGGGFDGY